MQNSNFPNKWRSISQQEKTSDEISLYVERGNTPLTQRQLNLYYYFLFIKDILEQVDAKDVLEIGAGRGTISLYLKEYLGLNVALLDNSQEALEVAQKAFGSRGLKADFICENAENTNLPPSSYTAIVSIGLAEHLERIDKLFKEQFRLLKPGGVMISLNIPKKFSIQFLNNIYRFLRKIFIKDKAQMKKDYFRNDFKPKDYKASAEKVGFSDVKITYVCPFPIYTPLSIKSDKKITKLNKAILNLRSLFQKYPYKTNPLCAQAHFVVGYKDNE